MTWVASAALVLAVLATGCGSQSPPKERPSGGEVVTRDADARGDVPDAAPDAAPPDAAPAPVDAGVVRDAGPGAPIGNPGTVCHCFAGRADQRCKPEPCTGGLVCGYPCGVQGCHSICMTAEEAERSKYRPSTPRR